ncbi:MAG: cupin domain-containing protein [Alicyclobacillus herbarius]|uniref:cupin domain-containing protein n=1 Tax=Alicyclobacillus herbarius TaxID=122960 RepID=UPI0003FCB18C|nr:cupin domain-containing protein [Alicyclobacillus herbarius]MCL6633134.1 cupin domain-containing protein [Alicyclobacillus herbarius]
MILVHEHDVESEGNGYALKLLLENEGTRLGIVTIPAGTRIPFKGTGAHEQDEYSYIVKGSLVIQAGDKLYRVQAGDATLIPAGEAHWCYNDGNEDALIVWSLVRG